MNIVLVYGGRDYDDQAAVFADLDREHAETPIDMVIEGGAPGADQLGGHWARKRDVPCLRVPAEWRRLGPAAGPIRNAKSIALVRPTKALQFPGHDGTADMREKLDAARIPVIECPRPALPAPPPPPPPQSDLFS